MREPTRDFELDGAVIHAGSVVFISPYLLHHDARFFPDPEEFRPERFSRENEKGIVPGAYVPFAAGPRVCLGKSFAMMEARLILGTLVQRCRFRLPDDYRLAFLPQLSLRPKNGMPGSVEFRARSSRSMPAEQCTRSS
jgi:cytochrome P450